MVAEWSFQLASPGLKLFISCRSMGTSSSGSRCWRCGLFRLPGRWEVGGNALNAVSVGNPVRAENCQPRVGEGELVISRINNRDGRLDKNDLPYKVPRLG